MEKLDSLLQAKHDLPEEGMKEFLKLEKLLQELDKKPLNEEVFAEITSEIEQVNNIEGSTKEQISKIKKAHSNILKIVRKKLHYVPEKYYQNLWMVLGMSSFGLPIGVIYGMLLDNMAFLGLGMPLGMAFGIFLGKSLDDKAEIKGRVLFLKEKLTEKKS